MNAVQEEWEKMRIAYQNRYAKMCKKIKKMNLIPIITELYLK